jgi:DHA1 family multidrug resistance protein-like MFS transporter
MISPIISLFIEQLDPTVQAATVAGIAFSLMGIVAGFSSLVATRLGKRIPLNKLLVFACLGTGLLYLPPMLAKTVTQLVILVATMGLLNGGLMMSANSLVSLSVSQSQQGIAYGLSTSAQALGGGLGPLLGGGFASLLGFKPVFGIAGGLFILVAGLIFKLLMSKKTVDLPTREAGGTGP